MKRQNGAAPQTALIGWVFIDRYHRDGITIRWRRGDPLAYILPGNKLGDHSTTNVLGTIPVQPAGWTDHNEIRHLAQRWQHH
jgi:hypothetical protein